MAPVIFPPRATPIPCTHRVALEEALGTPFTDDYGTPPYPAGWAVYDDATLSAFLGETDHHATGHANAKPVVQDATARSN